MRKYYRLVPAGLWLALIWTLSSLPADEIPSVQVLGIDKLLHLGIYTVLMVLFSFGIKGFKLTNEQRLLIISVILLMAAGDEYHQHYIPGRSVSVYDLIANGMGIIVGFLIGKRIYDPRS